ncbi:tetratricopeptide repeat protein [Bdellovibrio sp. HCB337]|uniref:tetratricopeptide repeat protein n=1 Tax=Bdellovibrio sp. HCB337 TaxID=3394358 RepID=UPI0039A778AA
MSKKLIVKDNWLSFLHASSVGSRQLQGLILSGQLQAREALTKKFGTNLSTEEISFICEKTLQVLGRFSELEESLETLSAQAPAHGKHMTVWQERVFLKGFVLSRSGRKEEARKYFEKLPQNFSARIQTELALHQLNQGDLIQAESLFKQALENHQDIHDPYSLCTLLGGLTLALIQQGHFREAELRIKQRRHILKHSPSASLSFGTRLYEILLLLEKNDFLQADALLKGTLGDQNQGFINEFFLLHLKLRLHLSRNELDGATKTLQEIKGLVRRQKIPEGVLDFRLEEVDLLLRSHKATEALDEIREIQTSTASKGDHFLFFRLSLLHAQALYQKGDLQKAFQEINKVIQDAERRQYRPGLSWALFHGAGIAIAAGHPVQAKLYLQRGERLANELSLRVRFSCFSYMSEVMGAQKSKGEALLSLVRRQEIGPEMEYYLNSYSLLHSVDLKVFSRNGQEVINEPDLRRRLFQEPGLFWFQKEEVLLAHLGHGKMHFVSISEKASLIPAFRLFWNAFQNNDAGFDLKDIHQTRLTCTYREELHAGATKMMVTRIRDLISRSGLQLSYHRESGEYSLKSELHPYTLVSTSDDLPAKNTSEREEQILSRIAMEPFVSTRSLCQEFSVTRQALHPFLKKLTEQKKVRMVKRGPISGYILLSKK